MSEEKKTSGLKYAKPYSYVKGSICSWEGEDGRKSYNLNPKIPVQFENEKFLELREIARTTDISFGHVIRTACTMILENTKAREKMIERLTKDRAGIEERRTSKK